MAEEPAVPHTTMKRLVVQYPGPNVRECRIEVQNDVAVPVPGPGQVLIRVVAAINPSITKRGSIVDRSSVRMPWEKKTVVLSSK
jgi:hypothetical protein